MKQKKYYVVLMIVVIIFCGSTQQYSFTHIDIDSLYFDTDQATFCPQDHSYCNASRSKIEFQGKNYDIPSFHEGMINHPADEPFYIPMRQESRFLHFLKRKYDDYILHMKFSEHPRIPKIIHQIWIGPNKPPENFEKWRDSWLKFHPTWEYILWDEEKIAQLKLCNKEFIDQETNYGAKSDLIRYEIIYQFGGVYVDIDFECLKPLDFLHYCCDFYGSFFEVKRWPMPLWVKDSNSIIDTMYLGARIVNGIFAARKHHPILAELIKQAKNFRDKKHILTRVGPDYFKTIVGCFLPLVEGRNIILPSNYFFSWGNKTLNLMPETLGIHHYTGTWSGAYVKDVRFEACDLLFNFFSYKNGITSH